MSTTARFIRALREGEAWIPLSPTRLLITHPDRQPIVFDIDTLEEVPQHESHADREF